MRGQVTRSTSSDYHSAGRLITALHSPYVFISSLTTHRNQSQQTEEGGSARQTLADAGAAVAAAAPAARMRCAAQARSRLVRHQARAGEAGRAAWPPAHARSRIRRRPCSDVLACTWALLGASSCRVRTHEPSS